MFLNLYHLLVLDHIAPGAIFALIVAWFVASWSTRHFAVKAAQAHADSLKLSGEDRVNFLEWRIGELAFQAQDKVGPTTGVLFVGLMLALVATGIITCSGPKERPPTPKAPSHAEQVETSVLSH